MSEQTAGRTGRERVGPRTWWRAFRLLPDGVRVTTYVAAGLVLALVVASLFALALVRRALPQTDGEVEVPGLAGTVTVLRDGSGVPQLYADTPTDLAVGQGYVTAQERFFQMDVRRRSASGTLAELVGEGALPGDRAARTMGLRRVAEQELALLSPDTRAFLEAYAEGVNAYLADSSPSQLAVEYTLLGLDGSDLAPPDWTAVDTLTWLKAYAWDLGGAAAADDEVDRVLTADAVGATRAAQLWPAPDPHVAPVVSGGAVVDGRFEPGATEGGTRNPQRVAALQRAGRALDDLPVFGGRGAGVGSNAVVVSGDRTSTGAPILATDPHLATEVPGPWMQVGLHCREVGPSCPWDVAGFSLPGVPGVVQGHNAEVAWGMAAAQADTTDLVVERIREGSIVQEALVDGRWRPLRTRTETIEVAGAADETITVRATAHGPLLSDVDPDLAAAGGTAVTGPDEEAAVAVQWIGLTPAPTLDGLLRLALADDVDEARRATADLAVPAVDVVLADRSGAVAVQVAGAVPVRKSGRDGTEPAAGWRPEDDWTGQVVPFAGLPFTTEPLDGVAVAANQVPVAADYPYELGSGWDPGQRASRLRDLLDRDGVDVDDVEAAQRDDLSALAPILLPGLLAIELDEGYADDGQLLLRDWDLRQPAGSAAAAYLNATWRELLAATFHDELPPALWPDGGPRWFEVVASLLEEPEDPWWDDVDTERVERRDDVLRAAQLEARDELVRRQAQDPERWTWGHQHRLRLTSPGLVGDSAALDLTRRLVEPDPWEVGGGPGSVDTTSWDPVQGFEVTTGPSMRMVLSLADWDDSRWVALTGVSGHITSDHYTDQTDLLVAGDSLPFLFSEEAVREAAEDELTLRPAP